MKEGKADLAAGKENLSAGKEEYAQAEENALLVIADNGSRAYGTLAITGDVSKYTRTKLFVRVGEMFVRFSTVAGERGGRYGD